MEGFARTTAKALEAIPIRVGHPEERGGLLIALGCTIPERPTKDSSRSLDIGFKRVNETRNEANAHDPHAQFIAATYLNFLTERHKPKRA